MASILQSAARIGREFARLNVHPLVVAATGFLAAGVLLTFYWQAEAADRADLNNPLPVSKRVPGPVGPSAMPALLVFAATPPTSSS